MHAVAIIGALLPALVPQQIAGSGVKASESLRIVLAQAHAHPDAITAGWPPGTFVNDPLHAYEAAAQQRKPLTIFFGAYWCKLCFALKDGVLSRPEFAGMWTRGAFLVLDVENDDSYGNTKKLLPLFGVTEYPALVVLEVVPKGLNLKGRIIGFHTPAQFCSALRKVEPRFFTDDATRPSATGCKAP